MRNSSWRTACAPKTINQLKVLDSQSIGRNDVGFIAEKTPLSHSSISDGQVHSRRIENAKNMGELERNRSELVAIDDSLSPLNRNALGGYFLYRTHLLQIRERLDSPSSQTEGQSSNQQLQ